MKTITKKMRSVMLFTALITTLCAGIKVQAQGFLTTPSNADNTFSTGVTTNVWMNNATLRGSLTNAATAVTWDDGSAVKVRAAINATLGTTVTITPPSTFNQLIHPDVMLGRSGATGYCAVVYTAVNTVTLIAPQVFMSLYTVNNATANLTLVVTRQISASTSGARNSHIDLINKWNGTTITYDNFVIAWEEKDCNVNGTFGVSAYAQTIAGFIANTTPTRPSPAGNCINAGVDGDMVDVAGIERTASGNNIALLAYTDLTTGDLYYNEWDIAANTVAGETTLDNNLNGLAWPRIDGTDPYSQNGIGNVDYDIAYNYDVAGNREVKHINNLNAPAGDVLTNVYAPMTGQPNSAPAVACFDISNDYDIVYVPTAFTSVLSYPVMLSEQVDAASGDVFTTPANPNLYVVNGGGVPAAPVAIASSWWVVGGVPVARDQFVCWMNTATNVIACKVANTAIGYKPTEVMVIQKANKWVLYPNPAQTILYLQGGEKEGQQYNISDVLGRSVLKGNISHEDEQLDISSLSKGMYLVQITNKDKSIEMLKFNKM